VSAVVAFWEERVEHGGLQVLLRRELLQEVVKVALLVLEEFLIPIHHHY
jgi:hypothetical protein